VGYFLPDFEEGHYAAVRHVNWRTITLLDPQMGPNHIYPTKYFQTIWHNDPRYEAEEGWYFAVKK
jgi:predicted double-glycine peptidase